MTEQILYQDDGVTLTNDYITIHKYYFPLATSKTIAFSDIEAVEINSTEGAQHRWGVCTKFLNNWFPLDNNRSKKKQFIAIKMKNRNIKPSFTPDDAQKVFQIIWQRHTPQGREELQRRSSQVGKETELEQKQVMERMKEEEKEKEGNPNQTTENDLKLKN